MRYGGDFPMGGGGWGAYGRGGSYGGPGRGGSWRGDWERGGGWQDEPRGHGFGGGRTGYGTGEIRGYSGTGVERDWRTGRPLGGRGDADRVRAADIMTRNPDTVTPDTSLADVAVRMRDLDVGIIPVVSDEGDDRLVGVITDRDIVVRAAAEGKDVKKTKVGDHMTSEVETVDERASVRDVFSVMKREQVRRVPVTDDGGRLVGIIAQADLAVDYAGLDLQRETEVEEVLERISEPARPAWGGRPYGGGMRYDYSYGGERDMGDRLREGWDTVRRGARNLINRGYDRGWR